MREKRFKQGSDELTLDMSHIGQYGQEKQDIKYEHIQEIEEVEQNIPVLEYKNKNMKTKLIGGIVILTLLFGFFILNKSNEISKIVNGINNNNSKIETINEEILRLDSKINLIEEEKSRLSVEKNELQKSNEMLKQNLIDNIK